LGFVTFSRLLGGRLEARDLLAGLAYEAVEALDVAAVDALLQFPGWA
jgi:hypothetical protein